MFETTILALLQGVAEFLPISSSGHLVLGKALLGVEEPGLRLDVFLHVGTLLAVFAFYRSVIVRILRERDWAYCLKVVLSAVPAGIAGVLFKDTLETAFANPRFVGCALVFTGVVLTATRFLPTGKRGVSYLGALAMGFAQAVAILPGVSRSGMTLAAARGAGISASRAAEFSFLMSAPPIAGAALLSVLKAPAAATGEVGWGLVVYGGALAAVTGYFALAFLVKALQGRWFWLFGPYCLLAGIVTVCVA